MFFDQAFLNCSAKNEVSHINHSRNTQDSVSTTVPTMSVDRNVSVEFRNTQDNVSTVESTVSVDNKFSLDCNNSMNSDFEQYDSRNTRDSASTVMSKVSSDRTFLYSIA